MFIKRVNASSMKSHPVVTSGHDIDGYIPWREQLDLCEIEAEADDEGFDDLLESIEEGGAGAQVSIRRTPLNTGSLRRGSVPSSSDWDSEFADAQAHARTLLSRVG